MLGKNHVVNPLPSVLSDMDEFILEPLELLDTRYNAQGYLEGLVSWRGLPNHENSWVIVKELVQQFPTFVHGDKLHSTEGY